MKKLPEYFCIKRDAENPLWRKYIEWLNKNGQQSNRLEGNSISFPYYYKNGQNLLNPSNEITLEEWNEAVNGVTIRIDKGEVGGDYTVETTWKGNTIVKSKVIKPVLTYETIIRRSDGIEFYKDTIDGETIEQIKKSISTYRTEANKLQGLLKFHSNHF